MIEQFETFSMEKYLRIIKTFNWSSRVSIFSSSVRLRFSRAFAFLSASSALVSDSFNSSVLRSIRSSHLLYEINKVEEIARLKITSFIYHVSINY